MHINPFLSLQRLEHNSNISLAPPKWGEGGGEEFKKKHITFIATPHPACPFSPFGKGRRDILRWLFGQGC
jgi:hypothetical protein